MPTRLPRAPETPLPALAEFLAPLEVHLTQRPSAKSLERYVTGLLTEQPAKNCDTLARVLPGTSEQRLQHQVAEHAQAVEEDVARRGHGPASGPVGVDANDGRHAPTPACSRSSG